MKKKMLILIVMLIITSLFICPKTVMANSFDNNTNNMVLLKKDGIGGGSYGGRTDENSSEISPENNDADKDKQVCQGLLGKTLKQDITSILNVIKIIAPLLVVIFTIYELISAVASKEDDALAKAISRLTTRIILVAVLFFLPILLDLLLGFIDSKYSTCIG